MAAKRASSPSLGDLERATKRRAAKACQSCRSRKVRCDLVISGPPCTNCKLDDLDCVLLISRRGWKGDKRHSDVRDTLAEPSPHVAAESALHDTRIATESTQVEAQCMSSTEPMANADDGVPMCMTFDREYGLDVPEPRSEQQTATETPTAYSHRHCSPDGDFRIEESSRVTSDRHHHHSLSGQTPTSPVQASTRSTVNQQLPDFIQRFPTHTDPQNLAFLATKGALTVPEEKLRIEILRSYIFSIHPFMPILDLSEFLDATFQEHGSNKSPKISLLLFQAVMFAGLASLKPELVRLTGCESIKQARKFYFAKVRLLYDLDIEPDSLVVLQTLLLMSLWYEKWNDRKHTWHWTGLALSLACSEGLNREAVEPSMSPRARSQRRRIWWSLYTRDRLIALGTRRPSRIRDDDFDVPMLTMQDFDSDVGDIDNAGSRTSQVGLAEFHPPSQASSLALMYIELTKLCVCIGRVLSSQYTTLGERSALTNSLMVVPRSPQERALELEKRDTELEEWFQNLPPQIHAAAQETATPPLPDALRFHWSLLNMIQLTAISILHRPQVLQPCPGNSAARGQRASQSKVKDAARQLTKITHAMLRRDQVRFLPTSGVPALVSASLGHMLDIKSHDEDIRDASIFRFYQTMQVLQRLREIYASADSAVAFLAMAVRKAGVSHSIQLAAQATPEFMIHSPEGQIVRSMTRNQSTTAASDVGEATQAKPAKLRTPNGHGTKVGEPTSVPTSNHRKYGHIDDSVGRQQNYGPSHTDTNNTLPGTTGAVPDPSATLNNTTYTSDTAQLDFSKAWDFHDVAMSHPMSFWLGNEDYLDLSASFTRGVRGESAIAPDYDFVSDAFGLLDVPARPRDDEGTIVVDRTLKSPASEGDEMITVSRTA